MYAANADCFSKKDAKQVLEKGSNSFSITAYPDNNYVAGKI